MKTKVLCLSIAAGFAVATGAWAQPDLLVGGLVINSPATLTCGSQTVTFTVNETNAGTVLSGTFHVDLLRSVGGGGFTPVCRLARPAIRAGRTRTITLSCTFWNGPCDCLPTAYTTTFQAQIDSLNANVELDETNNLSNLVAVPSTCP